MGLTSNCEYLVGILHVLKVQDFRNFELSPMYMFLKMEYMENGLNFYALMFA